MVIPQNGGVKTEPGFRRLQAAADLVFFDPDNGLEVRSRPKGRKGSSKYVYNDEIAAHFAAGRSALIYQHYPRKERVAFTAETAERLGKLLSGAKVWSFATPHVAFILAAQPAHAARIQAVVQAVEQKWTPRFFKAVRRHEESTREEVEWPSIRPGRRRA